MPGEGCVCFWYERLQTVVKSFVRSFSVCCHCHCLSVCRPLLSVNGKRKPSLYEVQLEQSRFFSLSFLAGGKNLLRHCVKTRTQPTAIMFASFRRRTGCS